MKESARYARIVEWSNEDECYVGRSSGLFYGGCHGDDELQVFVELCRIVHRFVPSRRQAAAARHIRTRLRQ